MLFDSRITIQFTSTTILEYDFRNCLVWFFFSDLLMLLYNSWITQMEIGMSKSELNAVKGVLYTSVKVKFYLKVSKIFKPLFTILIKIVNF